MNYRVVKGLRVFIWKKKTKNQKHVTDYDESNEWLMAISRERVHAECIRSACSTTVLQWKKFHFIQITLSTPYLVPTNQHTKIGDGNIRTISTHILDNYFHITFDFVTAHFPFLLLYSLSQLNFNNEKKRFIQQII